MKLKFPKTITIGSCKFKVLTDKKRNDGYFSYEDRELFIGTIHSTDNPLRVLDIIIHELIEAIHCVLNTRFNRYDSGEYEFHYSHKEHTSACELLAGYLDKFIV